MSGGSIGSRRWIICGLLLCATLLNYMDRQTLAQLSKVVCDELGLSNEDYGDLESGFSYAFSAGGIVFGLLADRWRVRWLYPAVLLGWSAAGFATAWARGFHELLFCRIVLGLFESGQWPCALVASQRLLTREDRTLGNSILQSGAAVGAILTPLVVARMVEPHVVGSWRGPFQVVGAMGLAWVLPWLLLVKEADLAPRADAADGSASALPEGETSVARRIAALVAVVIAINLTWQILRVWLPKFLGDIHGYDLQSVSWFTSAYYVATDAGCLAAGFASRWLVAQGRSVHAARLAVYFTCALLTGLAAFAGWVPRGPWLFALLLAVGFGALGLFPAYYSLTQDVSPRHQGKLTGALGCITWFVTGSAQGRIGRVIDTSGSYNVPFIFAGLAPLVAFAVLFILWPVPSKGALR